MICLGGRIGGEINRKDARKLFSKDTFSEVQFEIELQFVFKNCSINVLNGFSNWLS